MALGALTHSQAAGLGAGRNRHCRAGRRGSEGKPVGTVWLALAHNGRLLRVWREQFAGDRHAVRLATVRAGLSALADAVEEREG